jgi:hypothetical protein
MIVQKTRLERSNRLNHALGRDCRRAQEAVVEKTPVSCYYQLKLSLQHTGIDLQGNEQKARVLKVTAASLQRLQRCCTLQFCKGTLFLADQAVWV